MPNGKTMLKWLLVVAVLYAIVQAPLAAAALVRQGVSVGGDVVDGTSSFLTAVIGG